MRRWPKAVSVLAEVLPEASRVLAVLYNCLYIRFIRIDSSTILRKSMQ